MPGQARPLVCCRRGYGRRGPGGRRGRSDTGAGLAWGSGADVASFWARLARDRVVWFLQSAERILR